MFITISRLSCYCTLTTTDVHAFVLYTCINVQITDSIFCNPYHHHRRRHHHHHHHHHHYVTSLFVLSRLVVVVVVVVSAAAAAAADDDDDDDDDFIHCGIQTVLF